MVTIIIPTANRPDMLAIALRSVSEQTAVSEITEVIVSENGGGTGSRELCQQFSNLPIKYIYRDPPTSAFQHGSVLVNATWSGKYVAILHDDDWWAPDFLRKGIDALTSNPQASTYCSNCYFVADEKDIILRCPLTVLFWFGANFPKLAPIWELGMREVLLGSLLQTPARYSAILARADAVRGTAVIYDTGNPYDNDRMFIFELARQGAVLFSPLPQVFYRIHAQSDTHAHAEHEKMTQMCRTTEWMVERSGESWEVLGELFYERISHSPENVRVNLYDLALQPSCIPTLARHLKDPTKILEFQKQIRARGRFKSWVKPLCPPIFFEKGKRMYKSFRS